MLKNVRGRLALTALVIALAVWAFYPPGEKINLGLDLKGGVHLVLRVHTDDALKAEAETTAERLRDALTRGAVQHTKGEVTGPGEFLVEGIQDDRAFRDAAADAETVFDRTSGAGTYTYRIKPNIANQLRDETVAQALETIERRVNELGVAEPIVARYSGRDQILVQLHGDNEENRAKQVHRATETLQFRTVDYSSPDTSRDAS